MMWIRKLKIKINNLLSKENKKISLEALKHNSLENVDFLNKNINHWLRAKDSDERFLLNAYQELINMVELNDEKYVADYGCGTGVLVNLIKSNFQSINITGYDFSTEKIDRCKEFYTHLPGCFAVGSLYEVPKNAFDVIFCTEVLEHLDDPELAFNNLIGGLKKNGKLVITVPNGRTDTFIGHIHFWSPESWKLFIEKNSLSSIEVRTGSIAGKLYAFVVRGEN